MDIEINKKAIESLEIDNKKINVLGIVLATKPCFYKLWSLITEAKKQKLPFILINTGQHYDDFLGHGIKELDLEKHIAVNLNLRGDLCQKSSEIFSKINYFVDFLRKEHPNLTIIPYVNGDTMVAGIYPLAWLFATNNKSIQGEAGLRGMSPKSFEKLKNQTQIIDYKNFFDEQFNGEWIMNKTEPFPEQIDTYISPASCEYYFAPVNINEKHLIYEGYSKDNIFTVGNTVVDVIKYKLNLKPTNSVFEIYPKLKKGEWVRVDIHRRGNLTPNRFKSIIEGVKDLVENGYNVVFIELNATKQALIHYGLRDSLIELNKKDNFLFTGLWKEYAHVIEFITSKNCWGILTDSGSMQEEMNELGKPCMTVRFNTDRPETVFDAKSNVLVPPLSKEIISGCVKYLHDNKSIFNHNKKLYGENVAEKTVKTIANIFKKDKFFTWSHEHLNIYYEKKGNQDLKYL